MFTFAIHCRFRYSLLSYLLFRNFLLFEKKNQAKYLKYWLDNANEFFLSQNLKNMKIHLRKWCCSHIFLQQVFSDIKDVLFTFALLCCFTGRWRMACVISNRRTFGESQFEKNEKEWKKIFFDRFEILPLIVL